MDRTVRLLLQPTAEQADALAGTLAAFTTVFNAVCAEGWRRQQGNAFNLQRFTYHANKAAVPALVSDLHIQAIHKASEALKAAITRQKQGRKTGQPRSASCPPRYNVHTYKLRWAHGQVNLSSVHGRLLIPFTLPAYAQRYHGANTASADLICRKGRWWLHVVISLPAVPIPETGQAIGVDLGICRPAVTSDNRFLGTRHWREIDRRAFRLRRALQSNGSESAKRHLRRLAGRTQRFRRDCDHVLSKRILAGVAPGTTIVVENLTNLRTRVKARRGDAKRRLHSWSFAQLKGFLTYKAEDQGCRVVGVDPRHTSQRCNRCGHIARGNRPEPALFACRACGFRANADANAARNIRDRYLVGWGKSPDRRAAVKQPIVGAMCAHVVTYKPSALADGS